MPIRIQCRSCKKVLQVPDSAEGKKAKCPSCQNLVKVERPKPTAPTATSFPKPVTQPASVSSGASNISERIEVKCHGCGKRMRVPAIAAGKAARCPECKVTVPIPMADVSGSQSVPLQPQLVRPSVSVAPSFPIAPSPMSASPLGDNSVWETQQFPPGETFGGTSSHANPYEAPFSYGNYSNVGGSGSRSTQYNVIGVFMMLLGVLFAFASILRVGSVALGFYLVGSKLDYDTIGDVIIKLTISTAVGSSIAIAFVRGGLAFTRQSNLRLARWGAALMAIPFFGLCLFPVGIWACVLAFGERIKRDFD